MDATMEALVDQLNNMEMESGLSGIDVLNIAKHCFNQAAFHGQLTPFKSMVSEFGGKPGFVKAIFSVRDENGLSILHMAAIGGSKNVIKYLLKKGKVDIDIKCWKAGHTALHYAIVLRKEEIAIFLLEKGASPNAETQRTRTPLHYAAEYGTKKLILLLISKGANVNAVADCGTPLQVAAKHNKESALKVLLEKHANPNQMSHDLLTPLIQSIVARSNECTKTLIKAGADPNVRASKGRTSLGWAACVEEGDAADIIKLLLNARADPDVTDNLGMTPLEVAALVGCHQNVMVLFPMTSPIPKISEWTIEGVMKYVQSDEATQERDEKLKKHMLLSIARGADCLKRKEYFDAIQHYSEAIRYDCTDAVLFAKRSLCWARLNEGESAMNDAQVCLHLRPQWPKAYLRVGAAFMVLKEFEKASRVFQNGLKLDRNNEELKCAFREALEAKKTKPVWSFGPESMTALGH